MKFREIKTIKEASGYYNPQDQERREQDAMDNSRRDFKRQEMQHELGHEDHPDFERNLLRQAQERDRGPWYIRIDGVVYKQKGQPKVFDLKKGANNYALAMIKNNPGLQGKIMLSKNSQDNPTEASNLVENDDDAPMYGAIIHRIMVAHPDLLSKYGPEKIMMAAQEEAEWVGDVEEIGSSDVSISVKRVMQALQEQNPTESIVEAEGEEEGLPHITRGLLKHILDQVAEEGPHAIAKSVEWGDGAAQELTDFIVSKLKELETSEEVTEDTNPEDKICVDVPLFIRLMEYAREDAKTDMDLHRVTERLTAMSASGKTLDMSNYDAVTGTVENRSVKPGVTEATGHPGYDNMLKVLQAVEAGEDAHFDLAGEPITLEYPEARFLGGKYKAFLKAGRQEEFLKYMNDPVMFDRLMLQLRQLIDKQKNFKGSVQGQRGVEEAAPVAATLAGGLGLGLVAAAGAPAIVGILGPLLGIPFAAYGAYSAAKLGMKGVEKLWDMAAEKLGSDDKVTQYTNSKIAALPPEQAQAAAAVVKQVSESRISKKSLPESAPGEYYCNVDRRVKAVPEGYKKLASGYITRK